MTTPATTPADGELLPCPFCNTHDDLDVCEPGTYFAVMCGKCECEGPPAASKGGAIVLWNGDRATPSPGKAPEPVAWIPDDALAMLKRPLLVLDGVRLYRYNAVGTSPLYASPGKAEAELDAKDAARYRWLRLNIGSDHVRAVDYPMGQKTESTLDGLALDTAIDAAIQKESNHD